MSTIDSLLELVKQDAFQKAGGGQPDTIDKINATFGNINTIIKERMAAKRTELETRKLEDEAAKSFEIDETIPEVERQGLTETQRSRIGNLKSKVDTMNAVRKMQAEARGEQFQPFDYPKEITSLENAPIPTTRKRKVSKGEYETYTQGKLREAQAQAALRERPQSDFTPFLATKDIETLTGGKIKENSMTNMAIVKQFSAGERAETIAGAKPPTDTQSVSGIYVSRMEDANAIIDRMEKYAQSANAVGFQAQTSAPNVANPLRSGEFQSFDQARKNFLNAVLRKESGAVISPSEIEEGNRQYFPLPGDSDEVLLQKRQNRATATAGMKVAAGKAYKPRETALPEGNLADTLINKHR